jgi:succinate dehydrogenase / fumarate reductase, iron-sulfur subunit
MTTQESEPAFKIDITGSMGGDIPTFQVTLRVRCHNPEVSEKSYWENFPLTMYGTDRVLDALHKIKWEHDGLLSFRRSCAHGVCGSDAMRINGRNRLACKVLLRDLNLAKPVTVEPLQGMPVEKDLIVDMEPFFQSYREIMPFFISTGHEPTREQLQTVEERERFEEHHQVHPVRGLHRCLSRFLNRRTVLRPGSHRQCPPVYF